MTVRNNAMVLCNDFMDMLLFFIFFVTGAILLKYHMIYKHRNFQQPMMFGFSIYHPSNLMITADFTLVLVFINFLWAVYFYYTQSFDITAFASNFPKLQDAVKITDTGPRSSLVQMLSTENFRTISPVFGPQWTRMWKKVTISLCISIRYDGLTLPRLHPRTQKCKK